MTGTVFSSTQKPISIRTAAGRDLDPDMRAYIRRRLTAQLGKHADSISRVTVRVRDINGPRGGVDQVCRIKVVLKRLPSVVYTAQASSLQQAIQRAIGGTERAVRRTLRRRVRVKRTPRRRAR
jgi:ribosome-associated translation inhibitor RaiA